MPDVDYYMASPFARALVAEFYNRHRRALITVARFAGRPVAYGLFVASMPF